MCGSMQPAVPIPGIEKKVIFRASLSFESSQILSSTFIEGLCLKDNIINNNNIESDRIWHLLSTHMHIPCRDIDTHRHIHFECAKNKCTVYTALTLLSTFIAIHTFFVVYLIFSQYWLKLIERSVNNCK